MHWFGIWRAIPGLEKPPGQRSRSRTPAWCYEPADAQPVSFPNLKPTSHAISIRFPEYVLDAVKAKANAMGVPYQALIKEAVIRAYVDPELRKPDKA